jgi:hypothetical protein
MRARNGRAGAAMVASLLASLAAAAPAATQTSTDERLWTGLAIRGPVGTGGEWRWASDSLVRSRDGAQTLDFLGERIMVSRRLSPHVDLGLGYAYGASFSANGPLREHRIVQQVSWVGGNRAGVSFRTLVEERFVTQRDPMLRLRQRARLARPIAARGRLLAVVSEELFVRTNAGAPRLPAFDGNRLFVGLGWKVGPRIGVEAGYLHVHSRPAANRDQRSHVLSVTLSVAR